MMRMMCVASLVLTITGFAFAEQIKDLNQLVGRKVVVQRMPLCEPGTYKAVLAYSGKSAVVISIKASTLFPSPVSQSALARMTPEARAMVEDQQKAATVLVQVEDGKKLDTCAPVGPARISEYLVLAEGETLAADTAARPSQSTTTAATRSALPPGSESLSDGVYCKTPEGWTKLEQTMMVGGGTKHIGKMLVPGLTPQMVWTYRGATAPVQLTERKPLFLIKQPPAFDSNPGYSARDRVIVRFDKKKDHRELQTTSGGSMFTFKAGFSKERMPEIDAHQVAPGLITVVPLSDLKPGEYLLTIGLGGTGYDFGIK